ncbi:GyrI-like domain-containing protein [Klugiella xanthotipulae]|uniref:GyrI-like small molecule binding domain-containing protein n=1 Tax=Klugiella xanthotipulae TaxID=244735 RepID=A0A543HRY3_9MICO|nr:GyrI-like domain-containing protein [Klugiella xanthotipulae]TQM61101.1 hypothetical protein FB466_2030 [Klugiella xanthotipulae]
MPDTYPKVDLKKHYGELFSAGKKDFAVVEVPPLSYLMVDGAGDPNTEPSYTAAVEALYSVSFTAKFASKKQLGRDYTVSPLEGLWWADNPEAFTARDKSSWKWTMMVLQPEWVTAALISDAIETVRAKKNPTSLDLLRFETYHEGTSVQILHVGSYDDEAPTLARLHNEYLPDHGLTFNGKHHEIYLGDPRKTEPARLKTLLRQPVRRIAA